MVNAAMIDWMLVVYAVEAVSCATLLAAAARYALLQRKRLSFQIVPIVNGTE